MLLIECPYCGERPEPEFVYGGQAHVARPRLPAEVSAEQWARYLYFRDNAKGAHRELWCHSGGCSRWFVVHRDTVSHAILATAKPGASARLYGDRP